jgi:hypothetical protein
MVSPKMIISENYSNMRIITPQQSFFIPQIQHKSNFWWQTAGMETSSVKAIALLNSHKIVKHSMIISQILYCWKEYNA